MLQKRILVIEQQEEIFPLVKELFEEDSLYKIRHVNTQPENIKEAIIDIPDIILINSEEHIDIYKGFLEYDSNFMIPVIVMSSKCKNIDILRSISTGINLYIIKPVDKNYLYYTIKNYVNLIYTNRSISALTRLPGNIQITHELQRRTAKREAFYVLYIDLDNFKAYNDTYGFLKGDEVIKLAANVIVASVSEYGGKGDFVGHIRR